MKPVHTYPLRAYLVTEQSASRQRGMMNEKGVAVVLYDGAGHYIVLRPDICMADVGALKEAEDAYYEKHGYPQADDDDGHEAIRNAIVNAEMRFSPKLDSDQEIVVRALIQHDDVERLPENVSIHLTN